MLTIQKLVLLLERDTLNEFRTHLSQTGNSLPLKLVEAIDKNGLIQPDSDELCKTVYGDAEEKSRRKFFQLAHYTFRLTSFLAKRYPFYLTHNLRKIEKLFNSGEQDQALELAENLLDIAVKIEDFATQTWVLKFMINFSLIREKRKEAIRQQQILNLALDTERIANEIHLYIRENLNFKDKNTITVPNTSQHIEFFSKWKTHESFTVRILSSYGSCYTLSFLDDRNFYTDEVRKELELLVSELDKHSYIIFPFADDVLLNIDYLHLKHLLQEMDEETILKEATRLTRKWNTLRFWQTHINTAQIVSLSLQASYFITHYCVCYKENYLSEIPQHIREINTETLSICEKMLEQLKKEKDAHVRLINLNNIYCTFLLLNGREGIERSVQILEGLLINYQQIPFQKLYDAIFANLIIGYFSLQDHTNLSECYRRYEKLTSKKVKIEENDLTIKAFYYVSQWQQTHRDQYVEKLENILGTLKEKPSLHPTLKLINELVRYSNLPLKAKVLPQQP
jgi:hypothetical protein